MVMLSFNTNTFTRLLWILGHIWPLILAYLRRMFTCNGIFFHCLRSNRTKVNQKITLSTFPIVVLIISKVKVTLVTLHMGTLLKITNSAQQRPCQVKCLKLPTVAWILPANSSSEKFREGALRVTGMFSIGVQVTIPRRCPKGSFWQMIQFGECYPEVLVWFHKVKQKRIIREHSTREHCAETLQGRSWL